MFDNLRLTDLVRQYASEADLAFAAQVADYWTQFARLASGGRRSGAVRWPACLRGRDRLLRIGLHKRAGFKVENRFMRARLALFRRDEASRDAGLNPNAQLSPPTGGDVISHDHHRLITLPDAESAKASVDIGQRIAGDKLIDRNFPVYRVAPTAE